MQDSSSSSCFVDFTSGQIVTQNDDHHHDRLLETQNDHYRQLNELPAVDDVLTYIDKMLMEDDVDEDDENTLQESSDFKDKERSFYELLGQHYPPSSPAHHESALTGPSSSQRRTRKKKTHGGSVHEEFDKWIFKPDGGCHDQVFEGHVTDMRNAAARFICVQQQPRKSNIKKKSNFDLRSALILCAEMVSWNDHPAANELLNQIRSYSSLTGNVNQRVAHYFVLGLEARLAGTGGRVPDHPFTLNSMSPSDYLLAYCTSFLSTSFTKIMIFASSKLIADKSRKSTRVHVIDFGIIYGLQWPAFIQRLSERPPIKLRITGINYPQQTEFKSTDKIEATGSRLAHYAEMFGVPFEYNAIVKSWESITLEELKIEEGEFVAVNCLMRAQNLEDGGPESPRDVVVGLIRKMNPDVFVHGVLTADYGSPYFVTRFRESLLHFSSVFDLLDVVIPSERPERILLQRILGSEVVNVIACEGAERVSRPETHKKWQKRHLRAGFKQLSFGRKLVGAIQNKVRSSYHNDFVIGEDHKWLLMSWKGRPICAISSWQPVYYGQ